MNPQAASAYTSPASRNFQNLGFFRTQTNEYQLSVTILEQDHHFFFEAGPFQPIFRCAMARRRLAALAAPLLAFHCAWLAPGASRRRVLGGVGVVASAPPLGAGAEGTQLKSSWPAKD